MVKKILLIIHLLITLFFSYITTLPTWEHNKFATRYIWTMWTDIFFFQGSRMDTTIQQLLQRLCLMESFLERFSTPTPLPLGTKIIISIKVVACMIIGFYYDIATKLTFSMWFLWRQEHSWWRWTDITL